MRHVKFAILTSLMNRYGRILLFNLCKQGFYPDCVIIERHNGFIKRMYQFYKKYGLRELFFEIYNKLSEKKIKDNLPNINTIVDEYNIPTFFLENHNDKECENILIERSINLILLGGTRILKRNILIVPKYGTLNAHPGILYKYRGLDVIYWTLKNNDEPGVTLHYVNEGIDLGNIIYISKMNKNRFSSIEELEREAERLSPELMVKAIKELDENMIITPMVKQGERKGELYKRMKYNEKKLVEQKFCAESCN